MRKLYLYKSGDKTKNWTRYKKLAETIVIFTQKSLPVKLVPITNFTEDVKIPMILKLGQNSKLRFWIHTNRNNSRLIWIAQIMWPARNCSVSRCLQAVTIMSKTVDEMLSNVRHFWSKSTFTTVCVFQNSKLCRFNNKQLSWDIAQEAQGPKIRMPGLKNGRSCQ